MLYKERVNHKMEIRYLLQLSTPMLSFKLKILIINQSLLGKNQTFYNIKIKIKIFCDLNYIRLKYIFCRYKV